MTRDGYAFRKDLACEDGNHDYDDRVDPSCGAFVCRECDHHKGLARCFCGWSASGGDGYRELIEMGERIEDE